MLSSPCQFRSQNIFSGDSTYNPDNLLLGDVFHSKPVTSGSPPAYFTDARFPQAFINLQNSNASRDTIIIAGANDGQFHALEKSKSFSPGHQPSIDYICINWRGKEVAHQPSFPARGPWARSTPPSFPSFPLNLLSQNTDKKIGFSLPKFLGKYRHGKYGKYCYGEGVSELSETC